MFDVANSSYTTAMITVFFAPIFSQLIVGGTIENGTESFSKGNFLWSLVLSISWLLTGLIGPLFGALSDVGRSRKKFLVGSVFLCVAGCFALYFLKPGMFVAASVLLIVSNIGYSLSENFISAFLPHISTPENIGKISGLGWGLGYFGGIGSLVFCNWIMGTNEYTLENFDRLMRVAPATGVFFLVFSLPTFIFLKEPAVSLDRLTRVRDEIRKAYAELAHAVRNIRDYPDLARFLVAFFFFQGGLSIIISFAAIYASQVLNMTGDWQVRFFLVINLTAALGAIAFGLIQDKLGTIRTVNLTLYIWISTILFIYFLEPIGVWLQVEDLKNLFLVVGCLAGACLGATQSAARTLIGKFSPPARSGEFFGFWGFAGKMSAVTSILVFGFLQMRLSLQMSMLLCSSFFIIGRLINLTVDEKRGAECALKGPVNGT